MSGVRAVHLAIDSRYDVTGLLPKLAQRYRADDPTLAQRLDRGRATIATSSELPGVGVMDLAGVVTKFGWGGMPSTRAMTDQVLSLANEPQGLQTLVLRIDSPGGEAAGTPDFASALAKLAKKIRVVSFYEDLGASAAVYFGSQATESWANASALVGSIGTRMIVYDVSEAFEKVGIKAISITSEGGEEFKGAGALGTKITDAQIAEWKREVNGLNEQFIAAVSRGRKMSVSQVKKIADGRVHIAADAQKLGLIDRIGSFDELMRYVKTTQNLSGARKRAEIRRLGRTSLQRMQGVKA